MTFLFHSLCKTAALKALKFSKVFTTKFMNYRYRHNTGSTYLAFAVSKKLGNAVVRNRIRRRMRHAAHEALKNIPCTNCEIIFIAKPPIRDCTFQDLCKDFEICYARVNTCS